MLRELFDDLYNFFCVKFLPLQRGKNWLLKVCIFATLIGLFFSFPRLDSLQIEQKGHWKVLFDQADSLFNPDIFKEFDTSSHESKMFYRIFVPVIIHVFQLDFVGVMCLQFLLSILTFYLLSKLVYSHTQSKIVTVLLTISSALILPIRLGFTESFAHLDIFALFFLVLACSYRNVFLLFFCIQFAGWTDERGLIASSLVFVFWVIMNDRLVSKQTVSVVVSFLCYVLIRSFIQHQTGYITPMGSAACVGASTFSYTLPFFATECLRTLEGFWILVFMMAVLMYKKKQWLVLIATCISVLMITGASVMVLDMVRSLAYLLPLILLAVIYLKEIITPRLSFLILVLCFCIPTSSLILNPSFAFTGNCFLYEMTKLILD